MKVTTIEFTEQEANVICDCMDIAVKATGLKAAHATLPVFNKIVKAFQSAIEIPEDALPENAIRLPRTPADK